MTPCIALWVRGARTRAQGSLVSGGLPTKKGTPVRTEKERVQAANELSRTAPRHPKGQRARGPGAAAAKTAQRLAED
jgi:hypothetical protein